MSPRSKIIAAAVLFSTGGAAIKWSGFGAWHGETPGVATLAGGALILGATAVRVVVDARSPAPRAALS